MEGVEFKTGLMNLREKLVEAEMDNKVGSAAHRMKDILDGVQGKPVWLLCYFRREFDDAKLKANVEKARATVPGHLGPCVWSRQFGYAVVAVGEPAVVKLGKGDSASKRLLDVVACALGEAGFMPVMNCGGADVRQALQMAVAGELA